MSEEDLKLFAATLRHDIPTLDIHGSRAHEASEQVSFFIAKLIGQKEGEGKIIYGIGTGALREAVLHELRNSSGIATLQEQSGSCIFLLK